jgi:RecB family endonuclease NucS
MRVYGEGYIGKFEVAGAWEIDHEATREAGVDSGSFQMVNPVRWSRPVPQSLIIRDISNGDVRSRLISVTERDTIMIETAQRVYERLGFGAADGKIVLLERGIEEAIKPNLGGMGLKLAGKGIQDQFSMGPGVGRADLICTNENGDLVVIELKRGRSSNEVIGQVLTYVGYVKENIAASGQRVHGWIITGDYDEGLRLAASAAGVTLRVVRLP